MITTTPPSAGRRRIGAGREDDDRDSLDVAAMPDRVREVRRTNSAKTRDVRSIAGYADAMTGLAIVPAGD
jgi:hypothetical protein